MRSGPGVARRLALRFQRQFARGSFFLLARELRGGLCRGFGLAKFLRCLFGVANFLGLGAQCRLGLALSPPLYYRRIVGSRLGFEFGEDVFPGFLRRFLAICETGFLESTH